MTLLDAYGLSRDDMMETMREMQFTIEKDLVLYDYFEKLDSQVKVRTYTCTLLGYDTDSVNHVDSLSFFSLLLNAFFSSALPTFLPSSAF